MPSSNSLSRLIHLLNQSFEKDIQLNPLKARNLVLEADVKVEDMMAYAAFDHPVEDCYGRQLVHDGGNFEVMVMSWKPGDYSSIHNHGYTQWGVVQVFGHTHHMIYNTKNNRLNFSKKEILPAGTAIKVNNALIHQMGNASTEPYLTLHVYGSNQRCGEITADAKNFDLEFDRIAHTCGGAFFNLPQSNIHDVEQGFQPTREVFMHYAQLLMDYYNRQSQSTKIVSLKQQLFEKMETYCFKAVRLDGVIG
ncbi:MAG: cysteine dioxygenase family protein [Bacteroidota bacterium]